QIDTRNYIYTFCISDIKVDSKKIITFLKEKKHTNFIKAYIITHRITDLPINVYDIEISYIWFMNKEIRENEFNVFSEKNTSDILIKIIKDEGNLINRQMKNLFVLWNQYPNLDSSFTKLVSNFIRKNEYLNEYIYTLAVKALQTNDNLIKVLEKLKLKIDPFSRETQYKQWLVDIRKFDFVKKLIDSELEKTNPLRLQYEKQEQLLKKLRGIDNSL
ncbi:hypothetical protein, partial [Leptospira yanagawae]